MTREETDALIQRLEAVARDHPRQYRVRVAFLTLFGYCYLYLTLVLMLLLTAGLVLLVLAFPNDLTIRVALVIGFFSGGLSLAILRSIWVRIEPPQGLRLDSRQAPALFQVLDQLRRDLKAPAFHEVLLVGDFNAAEVQVPRLGVFGWQRNHLVLGLSLMQALSPDEFRAVLAHEFAHLSRNHSRFAAWIYRVRRTWERVFPQVLRQGTDAVGILTRFIRWFWPKFNAHAFVLARANEFEADACSARLAGQQAAASALVRVQVLGRQLEQSFWPGIFRLANDQSAPPRDVFSRSADALKTGPAPQDQKRWLHQSFLMETSSADTHPSLKDRLRALGALPDGWERGGSLAALPPAAIRSAAECFLGNALPDLAGDLSERWQADIEKAWSDRHAEALDLRKQLEQPLAQSGHPATVETLWQRAQVIINLEGIEAALALLDQILGLEPQHAGANFVRGRAYLSTDDPAGVEFIERAMSVEPASVFEGCNLLYGFYSRTGQRDKLRDLEKRADDHQALVALAEKERREVSPSDSFLPHELPPEQLARLRTVFAAEREVGEVSLACKAVRFLPRSPLYVFCVRVQVSWWKLRSSNANRLLVERLLKQLSLPGHCFVFVAEKNLKALACRVAAVPSAAIYARSAQSACRPALATQQIVTDSPGE